MQRLVVSGNLPCSKEEAAILAGMQLRLEECWPRSRPPKIQTIPTASPVPHSPNVGTEKSPASKTAASAGEEDKVSKFTFAFVFQL